MTDTRTGSDLAGHVLAKGVTSRRGVMCGLAGLGAAGALAACGTAESPNGSDSTSAADPSTEGGSATEGGAAGIASTSDVPVGGGLVVDETVIVQPTADEFLAFSALCPHQGAIVAAPDAEGNIICPRHQSTWTIEGELEEGPAEVNLSAVEITVEDGQISLA